MGLLCAASERNIFMDGKGLLRNSRPFEQSIRVADTEILINQ